MNWENDKFFLRGVTPEKFITVSCQCVLVAHNSMLQIRTMPFSVLTRVAPACSVTEGEALAQTQPAAVPAPSPAYHRKCFGGPRNTPASQLSAVTVYNPEYSRKGHTRQGQEQYH